MYIVNICGQKLENCKFCKTLDVQQYTRLERQMRRLLYVACFTWIFPLRLPS